MQKLHYFYGDRLLVPLPTGSERQVTLWGAAVALHKKCSMAVLLMAKIGLSAPKKQPE